MTVEPASRRSGVDRFDGPVLQGRREVRGPGDEKLGAGSGRAWRWRPNATKVAFEVPVRIQRASRAQARAQQRSDLP